MASRSKADEFSLSKRLAEDTMSTFDQMPEAWRALCRSYPAADKLYDMDYSIERARRRLIKDFGERTIE